MSSPFAQSDFSPSSQRSTPSRVLPNGGKRNGYHRNLRNSANNSPSRQLVDDYSRMLINDERNLRSSLDEQSAAQHRLHIEALDRALAKHEQVRESAERVRVRHELEAEKERRRQEEEEKRAVEKARRELEEQRLAAERRRLEEENARAEERKRQETLKREQEEAKQKAEKVEKERKQKEEDERANRAKVEKDEADRKAREDAEAKERAQQAEAEKQKAAQQATPAATPPQTNGINAARSTAQSVAAADLPAGLVSTVDEREAVHQRYLDLHRRLKTMRNQVLDETKRIGVKNQLSDSRRTIQKCCGQLSKLATPEAKETNKRVTLEIVKHLDAAAQMSQPTINITDYLVQNFQPPNANTQGPAALLFLLNHFAKSIVRQLISESAVDPKSADSVGVLAVTIFARPQYLFNGQSLIDLLWAKYHKHAPTLFGISASERSKQGRARLGWAVNRDAGTFVSDQEHYDRLSGLASGFSAITLRDFSKSKNSNPAPNRIFWEAMARIIDTPQQNLQPSHFVLLKAMIAHSVPRIITTFGDLGVVALRQALIYFPEEKGLVDEKGRKISSVAALQALPAVLQREQDLTL